MAAGDIVVIREEAGGRKGNYYDGTDDYVLHDAQAVARTAANDTTGTFSAWIYFDDTAGTFTILSAGANAAAEHLSLNVVAGKLTTEIYHAAATQFDVTETTASMSARKWHHVAVVQTGTRPNLYVDGEIVAMTDTTSTDLTDWYDELAADKFAIGVLEHSATHTQDFHGAIGQVKYWNKALDAAEILEDYKGNALTDDGTYLQFNITYEDDGITDSGLGADNGTLTGHAVYGGHISNWSYTLNNYASVTGHAAEFINSFADGSHYVSIIKKGD